MILLNGHSLAVKDWFRPENMGLNLSERQSTATVTVGPAAPVIKVDDWLQDDTAPGKGIIWRVKTIDTQYNTDTRTIQLEHVISTLRDRIMFGEIKTQNIPGGNANGVSAKIAAQYVLSYQSDWQLGDFVYNVTNPYSFNGDDLFSAMETISSSLKDCIWEYDLTRYPFVLHIRQLSGAVGSEMRMSRNIQALKKTIDRSRMYTRFYPIGKNNKHIAGDYVSKNESLYGVVSRVETDQSMDTEAKLRAWATERLERHCEPLVTVTVTGLDLSEATGEPMDKLVIGRKCQVPLPEFGTVITERITKLAWSNKVQDPERVTVTLANELMDVATILKQQSAGGGRGGRNDALNAEEDHAWFVDTTDHVAMVAEAVAGEGAAQDWSRVSSIVVDGNGIHQRVTKTEGDLVKAESRIEINENQIALEASRAKTAEGELSSSIRVTAEAVTIESNRAKGAEGDLSSRIQVAANAVTIESNRAKEEEKNLSGRINVTSDKVSLVVEEKNGENVVKAASIVAGINDQTGSYVKINADTINLSGYVTMSDLRATNAEITNILTGKTTIQKALIANCVVNTQMTFRNHGVYWQGVTINGVSYHFMGYVG